MIDFAKLREPFPADDVRWKPTAKNEDSGKALAVAYVTARAIQERLDEVCGPENWQVAYTGGPAGGIIARLSIQVAPGEWVTKEDGAENTAVEPVKGGISGALRRVGSAWGIGRYLYNLPPIWVSAEFRGKGVYLRQTPKLPVWALPKGTTQQPTGTFDPDTGEIFGGDTETDDAPAPDQSVVTTTLPPAERASEGAPQQSRPSNGGNAESGDVFQRFATLMTDHHITSRPVADFLGVPFSRPNILKYFAEHQGETPQGVIDRIRQQRDMEKAS